MAVIKTKSGIAPVPVNFYPYSEGDVTRHLVDRILGFPALVDYERWDGAYGNAYVRMRVCIPAKYISENAATGDDFISRQLAKDGSASLFKEEVLKAIAPYRYPKNMENLFHDPEMMKTLTEKGIDGNRLAELIKFSKPQYAKDSTGDYFCIYLSAENIIKDMTVTVETDDADKSKIGKLEGSVSIISVKGGKNHQTGTNEPIRWGVQQDLRASAKTIADGAVTVDEIFSRIV